MTYQQNKYTNTEDLNSINDNLKYLSKKYHKYSLKNNNTESNHYTELLELKDNKIQELESIILSLKDEIEYMKYSLNEKIENINLDHKKQLFLLHKQQKNHIKKFIKEYEKNQQ